MQASMLRKAFGGQQVAAKPVQVKRLLVLAVGPWHAALNFCQAEHQNDRIRSAW